MDYFIEFTLGKSLAKAIEAHKAGRIQEAGELYTAFIQAEPTHPDAIHNLGLLSVGEGGIEEAITFFKVALTANPSVGQFWLSYMDCLMDLGRSVEAQPLIYQAKYKGTNGEIVDQLGRRLSGQGLMVIDTNTRRVEASSSAQSNILDTIKLDKALRLAKQKSKDGQLQEAKNICTDILQKFPKNKQELIVIQTLAEAYHGIANALMQKGDSEAAIEGYEQAISIKPDYAETYYNIGILLENNVNPDAAIDSYMQVLTIIPSYAGAYNNIGNALKGKGDFGAAIGSYNTAVLIKPDYAEAYYNLGLAQYDKGYLKAAIASYNHALKTKPEYAEAYNNIGNALKDKGHLEAAIDYYKQTVKILPNYFEASNMGVASKDNGLSEAAIDCYQRVLKIKPNYAEAYNNMSIALSEKGDFETAMESYKRAINSKTERKDQTKDPRNATLALQRALRILWIKRCAKMCLSLSC